MHKVQVKPDFEPISNEVHLMATSSSITIDEARLNIVRGGGGICETTYLDVRVLYP